MRTRLTIMAIVGTVSAVAIGALVALIMTLGAAKGTWIFMAACFVTLLAYGFVLGPWQRRWGATVEEVRRTMPGDEILPDAASTTRAITVLAQPEAVWPWLVQIGYGRAGWYSYDWIDNDGRPSADRVVERFQNLRVGDRILMISGMGPTVRALEPNRFILCGDEEGGTWCLALCPENEHSTRLVSRWRQRWALTPASLFWILLSDPGAFVMERKMLKGIRARAERGAAAAHVQDFAPPR